ncbi:MAG: hypothetical protein Q8Q94_03745 [bacterium]|nr:hypothetical protein [bacterium]MDZ4299928.1 hypothetical protein [Candidatus Sungbacteria bacterium]
MNYLKQKISRLARYYPVMLVALALPLGAAAQSQTSNNVTSILARIITTLNTIVTILFIIESVVFIWGVIMYIVSPEGKDKAKNYILYGIIGMAVTIGAWALARVVITYFIGGDTTTIPTAF